MTDQLRRALDELAADTPPGDRIDPEAAWRIARRRRRGGLVVAACVVVALGLAGGGLQALWTPPGQVPLPAAPSPRPSPEPTPSARPDADYGSAAVWWMPPAELDARLPWRDSVLPRRIDLAAGRQRAEFIPGTPALAAFAVIAVETWEPKRLLLLTREGELREVPAGHLRMTQDEGGNAQPLTPFNGGLSPDGWSLFAAQEDALAVYDLRTGQWRELPTPKGVAPAARWLDAGTIWVPDTPGATTGSTWSPDGTELAGRVRWTPPDLRQNQADEPYGIWVDRGSAVTGSYFLAGLVDGPISNPEGVIARLGGTTSVLALEQAGRGKMCCTVVGWLDEDPVAFSPNGRVLAWKVASARLYRVSEVIGLTEAERVGQSWAWHALG